METTLKTKINLRKDVLSAWTKADPVLGDGEMAIVEDESGQLAMKIGNGVSSFTQLPFLNQQELKTDKLTAKEATVKCISQGYSVSSTPTSMATGVFSEAKSSFGVAHGIEAQVLSSDDYAFVYSGVNQESITDRYTSHGAGTFNVNPVNGLCGFYVGEQSLCSLLSSSGSGTCEFTNEVKAALMDCFGEVAWRDDDPTKYRALKQLLGLPLVQSIVLASQAATVGVGDEQQLDVTVDPSTIDAGSLDWWSDDETIATVAGGKVTALAEGATTIYAGKDGVKAQCALTVVESTTSYTVTQSLAKCTASNAATSVLKGKAYECMVTADAGCKLRSMTCTMRGVEQKVADGKVAIAFVTGDIVITAAATELEQYAVSFAGSNYSASNTAPSATEDSAYSCVVTASAGYKLTSVTYSMGGQSHAATDGKIEIAKVTGPISVAVETAALAKYTVINSLTYCTTSNDATEVEEGSSYVAKITPDASCVIKSIVVTMGGVEQAVSGSTISISAVTGDIVVTAMAEETASYQIASSLSNVVNCNSLPSVPADDPYSTYLAPADGYVMSGAHCAMGDQEVEISTGWALSIPQVTADVQISAAAYEGVTDMLVADFQGTGVTELTTLTADLTCGDYVQVKMNLSSCTETKENVLGFGQNISHWTYVGTSKYLLYYTASSRKLELDMIGTADTTARATLTLTSDALDLKFTSDGVYVNDQYLAPSSDMFQEKSSDGIFLSTYMAVVEDLNQNYSSTGFQLGACQGTVYSKAYYQEIKVVRATRNVSLALDGCTASNTASKTKANAAYECTLTPDAGKMLDLVTVTMDGVVVEGAVSDGKISIAKVTGDIAVTAATRAAQVFAVTASLEHCTLDNMATEVTEGQPYAANVVRDDGYIVKSVTVTMGGQPVSTFGTAISIASVTGDIVITAVAEKLQGFVVTSHLSSCSNTNEAETVGPSAAYCAVVTPADNCLVSAVMCRMGDTEVPVGEGWTISVDQVTADIEISGVAVSAESVHYQKQDYAANSTSWSDRLDIDFWSGDYVEAKMNLSSCPASTQYDYNVLDVGYDARWSYGGSGRYHFYTNIADGVRTLYCVAATGQYTRCDLALSSDEVTVRIAKEGVYIDSRLLLSSDWDSPSVAKEVLGYMQDYSDVLVGSVEGDGRSTAYYHWIKVVHAPQTLRPHCTVTYDFKDIACSTSKTSFVAGQPLTCSLLPRYTCTLGAGCMVWADGTQSWLTSTTLTTTVSADLTLSGYGVQMESETVSTDISSDQWSIDLTNMDFGSGDLVEVSVDLANVVNMYTYNVDIVSFGQQIDQWAVDGKLNVHWYATYAHYLMDNAIFNFKSLVEFCTYSTWTCSHKYYNDVPLQSVIGLSKDGIWINGELVATYDECNNRNQHKAALEKLQTLSTIKVGRLQQDEEKKIVLSYPAVKVYRADMSKRQTAES